MDAVVRIENTQKDVRYHASSWREAPSGSSSNGETGNTLTRQLSISSSIELQGNLERCGTALNTLDRIESQRLQHALTVGESLNSARYSSSRKALPAFGAGKPYPPPLPEREDYVVGFDGPDDPLYPQNWSLSRRLFISTILSYTSMCSTFDSAIFSSSNSQVSSAFHVSTEVATLTSSLFISGYAFGPLIWAPLSELYGRRLPVLAGIFGFATFNVAVATAKDLQTLFISRFFAGLFGSCPVAVVAAIFSDIFDNRSRGGAIAVYASTVFFGPLLAPFIGGFINSHLSWRWTAYIPALMGYLSFVLNIFFLRESYPPVVLIHKAEELRRHTKNWGIHAKQEEIEIDFRELVAKNFTRPVKLLTTEPLMQAVTLYLSFIYGLLYCFLTAYTEVFQGVYGMSPGISGLPFFGMIFGVIVATGYIIVSAPSYNRKLIKNGEVPIPEWRLPPALIGGVLFAAGLFWFGWTGFTRDIPWIVPTLSGIFTGFGLLAIFIQLFNYLVDTYLTVAASAIAANTFVRSLFAASFPLFSRQMFDNMGIQWASTLLGCIATLLIPIPVCFWLFGDRLRKRSRFVLNVETSFQSSGHTPDDSTEKEA
ncbi:MFS transporter [Aspergillus alliaceus]|uniref:MFS transporter n=1 Tax=Petromyces alliaceus TaxID=209559 RepID=UPI0012A680C5|nr:major facilitator superfamily domain-containing protein [Aspergillus alliaceus]KAB8231992.1 major facilitator superfamily domain-containing protein [Aspergillus alliaceus]